jgi:hypothetical protein
MVYCVYYVVGVLCWYYSHIDFLSFYSQLATDLLYRTFPPPPPSRKEEEIAQQRQMMLVAKGNAFLPISINLFI